MKVKYKEDRRKLKQPKHATHLVLRWYHWSWRPRLSICYYDLQLHEQRDMKVTFKYCEEMIDGKS